MNYETDKKIKIENASSSNKKATAEKQSSALSEIVRHLARIAADKDYKIFLERHLPPNHIMIEEGNSHD